MRKIIKRHIEGGTRESHPRVQDLLQILDTRMGFPSSLPQCDVRFYLIFLHAHHSVTSWNVSKVKTWMGKYPKSEKSSLYIQSNQKLFPFLHIILPLWCNICAKSGKNTHSRVDLVEMTIKNRTKWQDNKEDRQTKRSLSDALLCWCHKNYKTDIVKKGHSQGHMLKIYSTTKKVLS